MFTDLKSYASTRDTALAWAKVVPSHWKIQRAKTIMYAVDIRSSTGEEELLTVSSGRGVVPRSSANVTMFQAASYVGHKLCWPDDLVINSLWAWGRGLGVATNHGIVSTAYGVYRQRQRALEPAYLHQLVRSQPFQWELQVRSQGVWKSRLQMTDERWLDAPLLIPPATEQAAIVKYLAHANARINKAIAAKRRLIALLESQKIATVNDSVVDDWPLIPVKRALHSMTAGAWGSAPEESDDPARWCVRVADFDYSSGGVLDSPKTYRAIADREFLKRSLRRSDLLLEGSGGGEKTPVGRVVLFDHDVDALCSNFLQRLRPADNVNPEFLLLMLRRVHASGEVRKYIKQTTGIQNLDLHSYMNHEIPMPSSLEQERAVLDVKPVFREIDAVAARLKQEIALLQEFRTSLVADVVTGQVDVRGVAATLPEPAEADASAANEASPELDKDLIDAVEGADV